MLFDGRKLNRAVGWLRVGGVDFVERRQHSGLTLPFQKLVDGTSEEAAAAQTEQPGGFVSLEEQCGLHGDGGLHVVLTVIPQVPPG